MRAGHRTRLKIDTIAAWSLALLAVPATAGAGAEGWQALLPAGCLPADGGAPVDLHVWGAGLEALAPRLEARCDRGEARGVRAAGRDLVLLTYAPGGPGGQPAEDRCWLGPRGGEAARGLSFSFPVCANPAGRIQVRATPDHLLAAVGQRAVLDIQAWDHSGRPWTRQPLEVTVNIGRAEAVEELGEGRYRAEYEPPGDPFPQVAVIMVANPRGARMDRVAVGRAVLPITARIELPGRTEPGTRMEMDVASRTFGPVEADRTGAFRLPILVPPGYGKGQATSIDRAGNRRRRVVDLFLPEVNQLGLWAHPRRLPADGQARACLLITTVDRYGNPADLDGAALRAERGVVSALRRLDRGLLEATYTAPPGAGPAAEDRVEVRFPGGMQRSGLTISLAPGPAARAVLLAPASLPADGRSRAEVRLQVLDAGGAPVRGKSVRWRSSAGKLEPTAEESSGLYQARLSPPAEPALWELTLEAEVRDPVGGAPSRLLLGDAALRLTGGDGAWLEAVVVDSAGAPVSAIEVTLLAGQGGGAPLASSSSDGFGRVLLPLAARAPARPEPLMLQTSEPRIERLVYRLPGPAPGGLILPLGPADALPMAAPLRATTRVQLYPPSPLILRLEALPLATPGELLVRIHAEDERGAPSRAEELVLQASAGEVTPPMAGAPGVYEARWRGQPGERANLTFSATDLATGVAAALEVQAPDPGKDRGVRP